MSQRRHSRSLQPSKAVLVSWEVDPECPTTATLAELLENKFGYTTASLRLPQLDAERLLADEIRNHMSELPTDGGNPFVLYYRGGGSSSNNGSQLHWKSQNGSGEIDWLDLREELFDLCPEDVLIVVDCNHGSILTAPEASPLNSARSVEPLEGRGKLEILAAPQRREPYHYLRFTEVLIGGLQRLATKRKHFLIMDLVTEMQKSFGPDMPVLRYRPLPTQGDELDLEVYSSTTRGRQPSLPVSLNGSIPGALPAYSSSSLGYQSVIILPITWTNIEGWDAYGELKILLDVFRRHFDYVIAPTVQIQQNSGAHKFVRKEIARRLSSLGKRDLLIVIYNGHASDAYAKDNRMLLSESAMAAKNCTVDWTELTNDLNRGDCDVVQILDCCYAAGATKGESLVSQETFQAEKLAQAANSATDVPEFQGRNETLAACGRDTKTAAGEHSSMKLFASVLHDLAKKQAEFSIHGWYSHIDTVVGGQPTRQWCTPYHKMNPPDQSQKSIVLRTKQGGGSNMR